MVCNKRRFNIDLNLCLVFSLHFCFLIFICARFDIGQPTPRNRPKFFCKYADIKRYRTVDGRCKGPRQKIKSIKKREKKTRRAAGISISSPCVLSEACHLFGALQWSLQYAKRARKRSPQWTPQASKRNTQPCDATSCRCGQDGITLLGATMRRDPE